MFYSNVLVLLAFVAALANGTKVVRFSKSDNFDSECNSNSEVTSIEVDDIYSESITYCFYSDVLPPGYYYTKFYDSSGNFVFRHASFGLGGRSGSTYEYDLSYVIPIFYFAQGYTSDETFTMKVENGDGDVHASGSIRVTGVGSKVTSLVANVNKPVDYPDYTEDADGVVGSEVITFDKSDKSKLYFNCVFSNVKAGQKMEIEVTGAQDDTTSSSGSSSIPGDGSGYAYGWGIYVNSFYLNSVLNGNCYLRESDGTEIDSKSVTVNVNIQ